jgi:unsaturated chondroitin disaccharide hydrolase
MKKQVLYLILASIIPYNVDAQNLKNIFSGAGKQTTVMIKEFNEANARFAADAQNRKKGEMASPRTLSPEGNLVIVPAKDWTSGFFPGTLWFLYEYTGKSQWKEYAKTFTSKIENEKWNSGTHDMGFKIYCSFGNGYRLTKEPDYREIIIQSAKTLSKRFNPQTGCIRSWDHNKDKWDYPVIIDNMMNLELLFEVTKLTGDSTYHKIAVSHADNTMKNHFRSDFSSYHVVDYDTLTGKVIKKNTHQGFSHGSAWARGQAWGLYGFVMCYRETRNKSYLNQARNIAGFILDHPSLPKDMVPYWDFNAPNIPDEPRDASAAAIIASALYELDTYSDKGSQYRIAADRIVKNLTKGYRSSIGRNKGFILLHSTGSKPMNSEVNVPLNYADYYYLEALLRQKKLKGVTML